MLQKFYKDIEGGVKGAIWTIGLIVVVVIICLFLFIFAPDLVYSIIMRVLDFVLGNFGI